ncbi:MAG: hypothetical protein ACPG4Z_08110 [Chitinophagales bacterium]
MNNFFSIFFVTGLLLFLSNCGSKQEQTDIVANNMTHSYFHWEDDFSVEEKEMLTHWVGIIYFNTTRTLGDYNFDIHFYMHRSESNNSPVPWAHTIRDTIQGVAFHVSPSFPIDTFLNDWTAQHEISHLSTPFFGKEHSWFAEGYATFMQYQVMSTQGVYTEEYIEKRYTTRIGECKNPYQSTSTLPEVSDSLRSIYNYADYYWAGTSYFYKLDKQLENQHDKRLTEIMQVYGECCRQDYDNPLHFVAQLDAIIGDTLAASLYDDYTTKPAYLLFEDF